MSFKRKATSTSVQLPHTVNFPTGIPSFDDVLGGGLPAGCVLAVLTPDLHSAYGELIQKYFIASSLYAGSVTCVIDENSEELVDNCMWTRQNVTDLKDASQSDKITIAWRYENMKQFKTTVEPDDLEGSGVFDLGSRVPESVVAAARSSGKLMSFNCGAGFSSGVVFQNIKRTISGACEAESRAGKLLRLSIPAVGSAWWGDVTPAQILNFLHFLRIRVRSASSPTCALVTFAPHICHEDWGGFGWIDKLAWLSDGCVSFAAFSAEPHMAALFPGHHGIVHLHSVPAPHSLLPPSDKNSTLRGLSATSSTAVGENNLAFKCTRKKLVIETLHLDVEGGVGERRTAPPTSKIEHTHRPPKDPIPERTGRPHVTVEPDDVLIAAPEAAPHAKPKKKKVGFITERPDIYDF